MPNSIANDFLGWQNSVLCNGNSLLSSLKCLKLHSWYLPTDRLSFWNCNLHLHTNWNNMIHGACRKCHISLVQKLVTPLKLALTHIPLDATGYTCDPNILSSVTSAKMQAQLPQDVASSETWSHISGEHAGFYISTEHVMVACTLNILKNCQITSKTSCYDQSKVIKMKQFLIQGHMYIQKHSVYLYGS